MTTTAVVNILIRDNTPTSFALHVNDNYPLDVMVRDALIAALAEHEAQQKRRDKFNRGLRNEIAAEDMTWTPVRGYEILSRHYERKAKTTAERLLLAEKIVLQLRRRLRSTDPSLPNEYDGDAWAEIEQVTTKAEA